MKQALLSAKARLTSASAQEPGKIPIGLRQWADGKPMVKDAYVESQSVPALINTAITETLRDNGLHFKWTALQLNFDTHSKWHTYAGVPGRVAIFALGDFRGPAPGLRRWQVQGL